MKIQSRFLLFLLIFYSLILFIGIAAQFLSSRFFTDYLNESVSEIFYSSAGSFTNSIDSLEQLTVTIMANEVTQEFLKLDVGDDNSYEKGLVRDTLMQKLSLYTLISPFLEEIILVDTQRNLFNANTNRSSSALIEDFTEGQIRQETLSLKGKELWSVSEYSLTPLILSRKINLVGYYPEEPEALLYFFVDIEKLLEDNFSQIKRYQVRTSIYHKGELFYSLLNEESDEILNDLGTKRYEMIWYQGEPHFVTNIFTEDGDWEFLFLIPAAELFRNLYKMNNIIYLIYILFFILFTFLIISSSRRITAPIITLSREMKAMDEKDFISGDPLTLPAGASDEVALLYHEFYQMIEKIDTLVNKNLKQELILNQSQLEALTNQLNPHFLNNTLDSLYWMAEINQQQEMAALVKSLSSLLRNSLEKENPLTTVKEQLDLLNDYFYIQKIRFKDRLEFTIDVDHQLYSLWIPRFTLQPLVENSIKYSLEERNSQCLIYVSILNDPQRDRLLILVRDNGPGMQSENIITHNTGIGLANLQQRLKLIYGDEGTLEIDRNDSGGTDIRVRIPLKKEVQVC